MGKRLFRRNFIKKSLALLSGIFFAGTGTKNLQAQNQNSNKSSHGGEAANETIRTIKSLRTTHGNFKDQDIPESKLQIILDSTVRAANSSNMQTYSIVVVEDRNNMKKLGGYQASVMLVYFVDYNRIISSAKSLGHSYYPDTMGDFVTASINTGLAVQTAAIAAKSLGLDYLITNGIHRGNMDRLWEILDLPKKHCFPLIALYLGYPTEEPAYQKGRLEDTGIIYHEKYHTLTKDELDEITRLYDDKARHISLNQDWDQKGHKHYLDWLFTAWARRPKPADRETQIFKILKRSGFVDLQKS
ncbi:MAG: nitroreductase [Planctomycetes bacterium]|nr:nitroreductase [Planctomycetota bacterium]